MKNLIPKDCKVEAFELSYDPMEGKKDYTLFLSDSKTVSVMPKEKDPYDNVGIGLLKMGLTKFEFTLYDPEKIKEFDDFLAKETKKANGN